MREPVATPGSVPGPAVLPRPARVPLGVLLWARALFGLDLRSLALFRVAVAATILGDLVQRAMDLRAHYSDAGVLPRAALIDQFSGDWAISLHLANGTTGFQAFLFALHALCALCLLVGLRTRLATLACWVLCCSLHARNPMVLQGGDDLLRVLLFWSLFLPLGARASVDALASSGRPVHAWSRTWLGAGAVAITLQICAVYWCTAVYKAHPAWMSTGNAVYLALNVDQMARPLGQLLLHHLPWLLRPLSLGTFWFEVLGPWLLFCPPGRGRLRAVAVGAFILFHAALGSTLQLGVFPFVCASAWLVFLPARFWEYPRLRRLLDRSALLLPQKLPEPLRRLAGRPPSEAIPSWRAWFLPGGMLGAMLVWNVAGLVPGRAGGLPGLERFIWTTRLEQSWRMFAPFPLTDDGWYVMPGKLRDGREVDLMTGGALRWGKPADVSAMYPNDRWRKYMMNLWSRAHADHRLYLGRYLCRTWNDGHPPAEQLMTFQIQFMLEPTVAPGEVSQVKKVQLWDHHCF